MGWVDSGNTYYKSHTWIHDLRLMWLGSASSYDEDIEFQTVQTDHSSSHKSYGLFGCIAMHPFFTINSQTTACAAI